MDRAEFFRRCDLLPDSKNIQLIDGIVWVAEPVCAEHGTRHAQIIGWLATYSWATPSTQGFSRLTWLMLDSAPLTDASLRIRPECGGQSRDDRLYPIGAPELAAEICLTSTEIEFGAKLRLYQRAGVREYITVQVFPPKRIIWRVLQDGVYIELPPDPDGILRSRLFPGLWLDVEAFWREDAAKFLGTLQAGLATPAHADFK